MKKKKRTPQLLTVLLALVLVISAALPTAYAYDSDISRSEEVSVQVTSRVSENADESDMDDDDSAEADTFDAEAFENDDDEPESIEDEITGSIATNKETAEADAAENESGEAEAIDTETFNAEPGETNTVEAETVPAGTTEGKTDGTETSPADTAEDKTDGTETSPADTAEDKTAEAETVPAGTTEDKTAETETSPAGAAENETAEIETSPADTATDSTDESDLIEDETIEARSGEDDTDEEAETAEIGQLTLVYGDPALSDADALVLLIMGDGFAANEQEKFYAAAQNTANYIMGTSPYDEFTDMIKIYALGVVSKESGVTGANAKSAEDVANDRKDTYFGASFWAWNMQRLLSLTAEGENKGYALREQYLPAADFCLYLVNSETYGGSGGDYCMASLNTSSLEIMVHEMGHTIADLSDEYYAAGYEGEYANLTADSANVPWERFIGKNGIGIYPWGGNTGTGYYMPSLNCKMRYLGQEYEFCEVCKEELRKAFCKYSNVTRFFFQPYADELPAGSLPDLRQYFILRMGGTEITGDALSNSLYLYYYDYNIGDYLDSTPSEPGVYGISAYFYGGTFNGVTLEPCYTDTFYLTVEAGGSYRITLSVDSKAQDGTPADVTYTVTPLTEECEAAYSSGEHTVTVDYTVTPYNDSYTYYYQDCGSDQYYSYYWDEDDTGTQGWQPLEYTSAPSVAGEYTVTVSVNDSSGNTIASKSADYTISLDSTRLLDNNDSNYYGTYGNNQNIVIYGEGFTAAEQETFNRLARELAEGIMATEPFKETRLYFNIASVNTVSNESGIGSSTEGARDTFFGLTCDADTGKIISSYDATVNAAYMAYDYAGSLSASIVIVNGEKASLCDTFYNPYYDENGGTYHFFSTIYVTPNDADWISYAAQRVLNHLTWQAADYEPAAEAAREQQRLDLIRYMHMDEAPIIVSRAYDTTFTETGAPIDLTPYFDVYYNGELLEGVRLALTYYDAGGTALDSAPSEPGTYSVLAVTVPDPEYADSDDGYQKYQQGEETILLTRSRGTTTYTIQPAAASEEPVTQATEAPEEETTRVTEAPETAEASEATTETETAEASESMSETEAAEMTEAAETAETAEAIETFADPEPTEATEAAGTETEKTVETAPSGKQESETQNSAPTNTGDEQDPILWATWMLAALLVLVAVCRCTRKEKS